MYHYIVDNGSAAWGKVSESIGEFSHQLIKGLIKGLSPNWAIYSTFSIEMCHSIVHTSSAVYKMFEKHF